MSESTLSPRECPECNTHLLTDAAWCEQGHACRECCECESCACGAHVESVCDNCEGCNDCCTCAVCSYCDNACDSTCENCERCERHCNCDYCEACERHVGNTCSNCGYCTDDRACCNCWYCEACRESHHDSVECCSECENCTDACTCDRDIYPYHTDPLDYLEFLGTPEYKLFLGVELEVECSSSPNDVARQWRDTDKTFLICKHDGSLNNGFEIVTAPAALDVQQAHWTTLLSDTTLTRSLTSWDTSTCGMHVHVSRKPISALTLGKILVFINSPKTQGKITRLAGRYSPQWAEISEKKLTAGTTRNRNRYEAVNLQKGTTIEFRIFKGTLDGKHVLANIEFCHAVVCWTMQASLRDCESWDAFWSYVSKQPKTYKHLIAYMS